MKLPDYKIDRLSIRPVATLNQALVMGRIRNTGRLSLTHDTAKITGSGQIKWFKDVYLPAYEKGDLLGFVGYARHKSAAYGLISKRAGDYWVAGAVDPVFRGKGYGYQLFEFLTLHTLTALDAKKVMLDVLESNTTARSIYGRLGYETTGQANGIITMVRVAANV